MLWAKIVYSDAGREKAAVDYWTDREWLEAEAWYIEWMQEPSFIRGAIWLINESDDTDLIPLAADPK